MLVYQRVTHEDMSPERSIPNLKAQKKLRVEICCCLPGLPSSPSGSLPQPLVSCNIVHQNEDFSHLFGGKNMKKQLSTRELPGNRYLIYLYNHHPIIQCLDIDYYDILTHIDIYWHILTYIDIYWHILTYIDIYWHILTYIDIFTKKSCAAIPFDPSWVGLLRRLFAHCWLPDSHQLHQLRSSQSDVKTDGCLDGQ